jgi:T4-like virus Myoviridae tail sheath stabiliser
MALDYFYDGQFRAYIVQIIRVFSGFQHQVGTNTDGTLKLQTIPCTYATQDAQVAAIIKNNTENTILSIPQMSVFITNIDMAPERRQDTNFIGTLGVHEREIDTTSNKYTVNRGKSYTVDRFMPVPYNLTVQLDIVTSNMQQKFEILEQILVLFNPAIDMQTNTNALDWTALSIIELTSVNYSSRSIPLGSTAGELEISSLTFKVPIWINPPAKVKKYRVVEQIITNISTLDNFDQTIEENKDFDRSAIDWARGDVIATSIVTPGNHQVLFENNTLKLLGEDSLSVDAAGNPWNWHNLFELYGKYKPGITKINLKTNDDMTEHETDIIGTVTIDETDYSIIHIDIDPETLPQNTLTDIKGIIDPHKSWFPNFTGQQVPTPLPAPTIGDRYIIINDIIPNTTWGSFGAKVNDIIEYTSNGWQIALAADTNTNVDIVLNSFSGKQLTWKDNSWVYTISGHYGPGYWRIFI